MVSCVILSINVFASEQDDPEKIYSDWDKELKGYTENICEENDVSYELVLAIIYNESRFNPSVTSECFSGTNYGLMQINYNEYSAVFLENNCGITDASELLDPKTNILAGVSILKYYSSFGDTEEEHLYCYQYGEGNYYSMSKEDILNNDLVKKVLGFKNIFGNITKKEKEETALTILKEEYKQALVDYDLACRFFNNADPLCTEFAGRSMDYYKSKVGYLIGQIREEEKYISSIDK